MRHYYLTVKKRTHLDFEDDEEETEDNNLTFAETDNLLSEVFHCSRILQRNNVEYKELDRGLDFEWSKRNNPNLDPENEGSTWLNKQLANRQRMKQFKSLLMENQNAL
jgi:hypothetical protein